MPMTIRHGGIGPEAQEQGRWFIEMLMQQRQQEAQAQAQTAALAAEQKRRNLNQLGQGVGNMVGGFFGAQAQQMQQQQAQQYKLQQIEARHKNTMLEKGLVEGYDQQQNAELGRLASAGSKLAMGLAQGSITPDQYAQGMTKLGQTASAIKPQWHIPDKEEKEAANWDVRRHVKENSYFDPVLNAAVIVDRKTGKINYDWAPKGRANTDANEDLMTLDNILKTQTKLSFDLPGEEKASIDDAVAEIEKVIEKREQFDLRIKAKAALRQAPMSPQDAAKHWNVYNTNRAMWPTLDDVPQPEQTYIREAEKIILSQWNQNLQRRLGPTAPPIKKLPAPGEQPSVEPTQAALPSGAEPQPLPENESDMVKGKLYRFGGKVYIWNGNKLVPGEFE